MSVYISQRKSFQVRGLFPTRFLTAFKNTLLITLLVSCEADHWADWMSVLIALVGAMGQTETLLPGMRPVKLPALTDTEPHHSQIENVVSF